MFFKGWVFVIIQFLCILFLIIYQPIFELSVYSYIRVFSILLALWAVVESRKGKLGILPKVLNGSSLITTGPYKLIRHPMYTSLLIFFSAGLIQKPTILNSIVYAILFLTLMLKVEYEESLLIKAYSEYKEYKNKSHRLIPFIY